jgi:hypothetical protein
VVRHKRDGGLFDAGVLLRVDNSSPKAAAPASTYRDAFLAIYVGLKSRGKVGMSFLNIGQVSHSKYQTVLRRARRLHHKIPQRGINKLALGDAAQDAVWPFFVTFSPAGGLRLPLTIHSGIAVPTSYN